MPGVELGVCALCRAEAKLEVSHLISAFVARRLRQDSPGRGFLRSNRQPNQRMQDGPKDKLLCRNCEELLATHESAFARDIFAPTMDGLNLDDLVITRDHYRFCISIAWRNLISALRARATRKMPLTIILQTIGMPSSRWKGNCALIC
jgi:hypothetical protein